MAQVTVLKLTDGKTKWWSLLIDSLSDAHRAVKDIIGSTIVNQSLNPHSLYQSQIFVDIQTGKTVFNNIYKGLKKKGSYIMNINGGYCPVSCSKWKILEEKRFESDYKANLKDLLLELNTVEKSEFVEIK